MALISCPECGHQVSDQAAICPNCGIKIAGNIPPASNPIVFSVEGAKPEEDTAATPAQPEPTPTVQPEPVRTVQTEQRRDTVVAPAVNTASQPETGTPYSDERQPLYGEPQKKNKSLIMMLSFIIALVVCIVGYWIWSNAADERMEQQRYEEAMLSTNVQDLKDYLTQYNDAPQEHRDSVNARLTLLTQEETDWVNVLASGSKSKLTEFLKAHPQSLHKGEAEDLIDSIDFSVADRKGTPEAYAEYLKMHPDSRRASLAQENLDNKKAKEVTPEEKSKARDVCKRFFQAINARNEEKLLGTVTESTKQTAMKCMNGMYKDDITNMNWHILDDFKAEKGAEGSEDPANISVRFSAEQNIERTDPSQETYAKYAVTAEITPEGLIKKFSLKKK